MPRQFRKQKPYIVVFCEGESEQMISELKYYFDNGIAKAQNMYN